MKKKIESTSFLKLAVLVFCLVNIVALLVLLRQDAKAKSNAEAISYNLPEEETDSKETENPSFSPVLTLDESLIPELTQDDLYDLKNVLIKAGALHAEDGEGSDITDQVTWTLSPVEDQPGTFDAAFTVQNEHRRLAGATVSVSAELTAPFLKLTEETAVVATYSDFSISPYIDIAMDVDGSDLTEYVTTDDYVNTSSTGTYNISIYVYSRQTDSMTRKNLTVTVQ